MVCAGRKISDSSGLLLDPLLDRILYERGLEAFIVNRDESAGTSACQSRRVCGDESFYIDIPIRERGCGNRIHIRKVRRLLVEIESGRIIDERELEISVSETLPARVERGFKGHVFSDIS